MRDCNGLRPIVLKCSYRLCCRRRMNWHIRSRRWPGIISKVLSAGAPTAGRADILPSGRNFTSADPHTFPTRMRSGSARAERRRWRVFVATEGHYPESIGIVLWATAQMRTEEGQCLAEIFDLLGVRPLRAPSGRLTGLELIPQEELQHPRLDVLMRISGLFRDTMPMSAAWLDEARFA